MPGRRACRVLGQHRSTQRNVRRRADDKTVLREEIIKLPRWYGRYGYRRIWNKLIFYPTIQRGMAVLPGSEEVPASPFGQSIVRRGSKLGNLR